MSEDSAPQPTDAPSPIGEISQEPSALESFLDANQKKLIIVGIALILALITYVIINGLQEKKQKENSALVSAARTVSELDAASQETAGTPAGATALFKKALVQWRDQQQTDAVSTLEGLISEYPEYAMLASAQATLASYHQKLGDLEKAKSYYDQAAGQDAAVSSLALIRLGDIARQEGDEAKAKEFYDRASSEFGKRHPNINLLSENHAKVLGVAAPAVVEPQAPEAPKLPATPSATSKPVALPPLPAAPDAPKVTPGIPSIPVIPSAPKAPTQTPAKPLEPISE